MLHLYDAWSLLAPKNCNSVHIFHGAVLNGTFELSLHETVDPILAPPGMREDDVRILADRELATVATGMRKWELEEPFHLIWGLNVLLRGLRLPMEEERFVAAVRAIEAVVQTPKHRVERSFVERCGQFFSFGESTDVKLRQIYQIRNGLLHMKDISHLLSSQEEEFQPVLFSLRAAQVEWMARALYLQLLISEAHYRLFSSREAVENFWSSPAEDRANSWDGTWDIRRLPALQYRNGKCFDPMSETMQDDAGGSYSS